MKQLINILWTGGLDSTFRLVELSREDVLIQPYYILDYTRGSLSYERKAMNKIYSLLKSKPDTKASLKDIKYIHLDDIMQDNNITSSWKVLNKSHALGSQYDWISRFAHQNKIILEVGLENSPRGKASNVLKELGDLSTFCYTKDKALWSEVLQTNKDTASKECLDVFQFLRFPKHLFSIEKTDEAQLLKEWGYDDILQATWFCHRPVMGYPCGQCNPCKDAINEGMKWRVPVTGIVLGKFRNFVLLTLRNIKKVFIL